MKATNNINADLKEEIGQLSDKASRLQVFFDDSKEHIEKEIEKVKKESNDKLRLTK